MKRLVAGLMCSVLVLLCLIPSAFAQSPAGTVAYRQSFADVSAAEAAGVRQGTRNSNGDVLSIAGDALRIIPGGDDRMFAILPYYNELDTYTVRFSFSVSAASTSVAYFSFMLTGKGDAPDNVTKVTFRINGEVDSFGTLPLRMTDNMEKGEKVEVMIPVVGGLFSEITVRCLSDEVTLSSENLTEVVDGSIGYCVRSCEASVYETAVVVGVGYDSESGRLAGTSSWTDDMPYISDKLTGECTSFALIDRDTASPATGDSSIYLIIVLVISLAVVIILVKRRK